MKNFLIIALILQASFCYADNYSQQHIDNKTLEIIKARVDSFKIDNQTRAEAQKLYDNVFGAQGQQIIKEVMNSITHELNVYNPNIDSSEQNALKDIDVTIFISASIPIGTLQNYIKLANSSENYNIKYILRGPVGKDPSKIMPTLDYISLLSCGVPKVELTAQSNCIPLDITIDPESFKQYAVKQVPTILIKHNENEYLYIGAVSIDYLLNKIK